MNQPVTHNRPERGEQLYVKRGRRYIPVVADLSFPCDGVWLVESTEGCKSNRCINRTITLEQICDVPEAIELARVERHRSAITEAVRLRFDSLFEELKALQDGKTTVWGPSMGEIADLIIKGIHTQEQKAK